VAGVSDEDGDETAAASSVTELENAASNVTELENAAAKVEAAAKVDTGGDGGGGVLLLVLVGAVKGIVLEVTVEGVVVAAAQGCPACIWPSAIWQMGAWAMARLAIAATMMNEVRIFQYFVVVPCQILPL